MDNDPALALFKSKGSNVFHGRYVNIRGDEHD
jgi:hypothetical protein